MKEILPAFDAMPDNVLPRYAWFAARAKVTKTSPGHDALITGNELNQLGQYYNGTAPTSAGTRVRI